MAAAVSFRSGEVVKIAALVGDLPMLKAFETASGMDLRQVKLSGYKGWNLLHLAVKGSCGTGRLDVCRYLVEEKGFHVNSTSAEGETPIFVATESDKTSVVPLLTYFLGRGGDPAAPDARGFTPLHNAAGYGQNEAIVLLLSRGIPVDPLSPNIGMPLHAAAKMGHAQAVKILLEHGADPNSVANRVYSPLVMACIGGSLECVKLLVEAGAHVNFKPPGLTVLLAAVGAGSAAADIVSFLIDAGADPNSHDGFGRLPIIQAALHKRHELVEILLPRTNPIPSVPDWSVAGIISTMKTLPRELFMEPIANANSEGKEAFANGDYGYALFCFSRASCIDPDDASVHANLSLCCLKLRQGEDAVRHAQKCRMLRPRWSKAWFREGEALSFVQDHGAAVTAFQKALKLEPANFEFKKKLREAKAVLRQQ